MASLCMSTSISRAVLAAFATVAISGSAAFASQGPGGGMGTASHFTQMAMAVLVYGVAAIVVCIGLIGAVRRR
jgi:type IV secretory pathway VirB2 component (pilin)